MVAPYSTPLPTGYFFNLMELQWFCIGAIVWRVSGIAEIVGQKLRAPSTEKIAAPFVYNPNSFLFEVCHELG